MPSVTLGPAVAGRWYPASPSALAAEVDRLVAAAPAASDRISALPGALRAVIAPHAGYVYSGEIAARALAPFGGERFDRVLLLGPSHYHRFQGAMIPEASHFATPLGAVPVDAAALASLRGRAGIGVSDLPFRPEHALESEIPFLQRLLAPGWKVVPVLVGTSCTEAEVSRIAEALAGLLDPGTLVVVSSDFTHYGDAFGYVPFRDRVRERLEELDLGAAGKIEAGDAAGFDRYCDETGATICGRKSIAVLLRFPAAGRRGVLLGYDTSGRMTGDWSHTVSYAALGVGVEAA